MKLWPHPLDPEPKSGWITIAVWLVGLSLVVMLAASLVACAAVSPTTRDREPLSACSVTDGDTLRCQDERVRLLGIDAPEMPGHCRQDRTCVEGDPLESKLALEQAIAQKRLTIERVAKDRYGRTLALVFADKQDVSCILLAGGYAVYVERWDNGRRIHNDCPAAAQ
ncbi:thermonuclease family protein [Flavisphingopyxis soli]